jgi:hypothetical protein
MNDARTGETLASTRHADLSEQGRDSPAPLTLT